MNRRWIPVIFIVIASLLIIFLRRQGEEKPAAREKHVNRSRGFDRRTQLIRYSEHARCRMACRRVSEAEVREMMKEGKINYRKSDLKGAGCPRYALEGTSTDNQRLRVVFAQCDDSTVVVTAIDLDTAFECQCPGD